MRLTLRLTKRLNRATLVSGLRHLSTFQVVGNCISGLNGTSVCHLRLKGGKISDRKEIRPLKIEKKKGK